MSTAYDPSRSEVAPAQTGEAPPAGSRTAARPRRARGAVIALAVLLAVLSGVVSFLALRQVPALAGLFGPASTAPYHGGVFEPPLEVSALTLQRTDGRAFSTAELRGRVSLFFFGYTHCPDVCPTTLLEIPQIRAALGSRGQRFDAYFVTVDPERDTPQVLDDYVNRLSSTAVGLTGTPEQLAAARSTFNIYAERRDLPGSAMGYAMDHTAAVFLVDPRGRIVILFPFGMSPEEMAADVGRFIS